jgi:hypothetical protein
LRRELLKEFHDSPTGGHSGIKGTIARLAAVFAWPNMAMDVRTYIRECLRQPLPILTQVWQDISMDFITHLPMVHGKSVIWVIVDRLTKYGQFIALPSGYSATHIAVIYMTEIYKLHGIPKSIVSDRDRVFISKFWKELFRLSGTQLAFSSAYHPQSDGQTEVTNRTLETYLRCYVTDTPQNWLQYLHLEEY